MLTSDNEGTCLVSVLEVSLLWLSWACPELAGELDVLHSEGMFNLDEKRLILELSLWKKKPTHHAFQIGRKKPRTPKNHNFYAVNM